MDDLRLKRDDISAIIVEEVVHQDGQSYSTFSHPSYLVYLFVFFRFFGD